MHLNDTRNDFKEKEDSILKEAKDIFQNYNKKINNIFNEIIEKCNELIKSILEHTKNKREDKINQSNNSNSIRVYGHAEHNFASEFFDNTVAKVMLCIPVINYIPLAIGIVGGLIDHFINHSEEYLKEIERIKKTFSEKIEDNCDDIVNQVESTRDRYSKIIQEIFLINGEESEKNWENYSQIMMII